MALNSVTIMNDNSLSRPVKPNTPTDFCSNEKDLREIISRPLEGSYQAAKRSRYIVFMYELCNSNSRPNLPIKFTDEALLVNNKFAGIAYSVAGNLGIGMATL